MLMKSGYYLIRVREEKWLSFFSKYSKKELAVLCSHIHLMLSSGLTVPEAIHITAAMETRPKLKARLNGIYDGVLKGRALYQCFNEHRDIFPDMLIKLVRLGEESGNLEAVFHSLCQYYERDSRITGKIKSSMAYPLVVFTTSIAVAAILMLKVMPQFAGTLKSLGGDLPAVTSAMLNFSNFLSRSLVYIAALSIAAFAAACRYCSSEKGRYKIQSLKLKVPVLKGISEKILLTKFLRNLSTLLDSGLGMIAALDICADVTENILFGEKISFCAQYIRKGENICAAFINSGFSSSMLISMIKIGEETGRMEEVLKKTADYFEMELEEMLKKVVTLIEPAMVIIMSLIIGAFIMAVMAPMVGVMDAIK